MSNQQITFEHLAWAAIFFGAGEPERKSYVKIVSGFSKRAINDLDHLTVDEVRSELIKFLQTWGRMRIPKERVQRIAEDLVKAFSTVAPIFRQLHACRLETLELIDNLKSEIACAYRAVDEVPGLGPTGVSKVLHVLNRALFVMWDEKIRQHYKKCGVITSDKPAEYVKFLNHMHGLAQGVIEDASRLGVDDPACFLSHKLSINPPLTLAKFIDEYNYMCFTREVTIPPPNWHPDKELGTNASI